MSEWASLCFVELVFVVRCSSGSHAVGQSTVLRFYMARAWVAKRSWHVQLHLAFVRFARWHVCCSVRSLPWPVFEV
jgi:hypothetical protein